VAATVLGLSLHACRPNRRHVSAKALKAFQQELRRRAPRTRGVAGWHGTASRPEPLSSGTQVLSTYIARLQERASSSYVGVGNPACQVGSRSSSRLPLGSKKYSSRPGKKPCSR
jgi:hypothetical protein